MAWLLCINASRGVEGAQFAMRRLLVAVNLIIGLHISSALMQSHHSPVTSSWFCNLLPDLTWLFLVRAPEKFWWPTFCGSCKIYPKSLRWKWRKSRKGNKGNTWRRWQWTSKRYKWSALSSKEDKECVWVSWFYIYVVHIIIGHGFQETKNQDAQDELEKIYEWSMNTQAGTKIKVTGIIFLLHDTFYF